MADDGEEKLEQKAAGEAINLKVVTQDGNEIFFKMRMSTQMNRLMNAFCQRQGVSVNSVRFLFDGNFITASDTPSELDMKDADAIDVVRV